MELDSWWVHGVVYDQDALKYQIKTFGPFTSITESIIIKQQKQALQIFDFIEVNQSEKFKVPKLV